MGFVVFLIVRIFDSYWFCAVSDLVVAAPFPLFVSPDWGPAVCGGSPSLCFEFFSFGLQSYLRMVCETLICVDAGLFRNLVGLNFGSCLGRDVLLRPFCAAAGLDFLFGRHFLEASGRFSSFCWATYLL